MWMHKYFNEYLMQHWRKHHNFNEFFELFYCEVSLLNIVADCIAVRIFKFVEREKLDI